MPPPDPCLAHIAASLAALGLVPKIKEYADRTAVEALVPGSFPAGSWPQVLALLQTADSFGFAESASRGRTLWAAVHKDTPAGSAGKPPELS